MNEKKEEKLLLCYDEINDLTTNRFALLSCCLRLFVLNIPQDELLMDLDEMIQNVTSFFKPKLEFIYVRITDIELMYEYTHRYESAKNET